MKMIPEMTTFEFLKGHEVRITFNDGIQGALDFGTWLDFTGIIADLRDLEFFRRGKINPDSGTIEWPNGADLDPLMVYAKISGKSIPELLDKTSQLKV